MQLQVTSRKAERIKTRGLKAQDVILQRRHNCFPFHNYRMRFESSLRTCFMSGDALSVLHAFIDMT